MKKYFFLLALCVCFNGWTYSQGTFVNFNSIPTNGTIIIFAHQDDDLLWMLPWWTNCSKFICGAMPSTPVYKATIDDQQSFLNAHGFGIDYKSKWAHPWTDISHLEYTQYYWYQNPDYNYLSNDHLVERTYSLTRTEIDKIKSKIEPYIADSATHRIITHNNWGEYGHDDHKAVNVAVRELAVKYNKDVWILGCNNGKFIDIEVPSGLTYTLGDYDAYSALYDGIRNIYTKRAVWTWGDTIMPRGQHKFIKIVDNGGDKSNILIPGTPVSTSGPAQERPGSYIFNGTGDYLTLQGNNYSSFTISLWVKPDELREMDISHMSEYPSFAHGNRCLFMHANGKVAAHIFDGSVDTMTSTSTLSTTLWTHIALTGDGNYLRLYINGIREDSIPTVAAAGYTSPEYIIGQAHETLSYFKGQIADVRLYDQSLSGSVISALCSTLPPAAHSITATSGFGGTISPSGTVLNQNGDSRTYTITVNPNYQVDVKVDGISVGAVTSYTFNNISTSHTIDATFTLKPGIALKKPIFCQSYEADRGPENGNDSDATNASFWSANPYPQWWKVDLQNIYDISSIVVRNYFAPNRYYFYEIWASLDNINFNKIAEKSNSNFTSDQGDTYNLNTTARFIKVIITYNSSNNGVHISDFRVYGTQNTTLHSIDAIPGPGGTISPPESTTCADNTNLTCTIIPYKYYQISDVKVDSISVGPVNSYTFKNITKNHTIAATFIPLPGIAQNKPVSCQSYETGKVPENANDTDATNESLWSASPYPQWWKVDLKDIYDISYLIIRNFYEPNRYYHYEIWASLDNINFTKIAEKKNNNFTSNHGDTYNLNITARFIKVIITYNSSNKGVHISDFRVYGTQNTTLHSIDAMPGPGGTISPPESTTCADNTNLTCTIIPYKYYQISDVKVDSISVGHVNSYTFKNITKNHTIAATFTPLPGIAQNKPVSCQSYETGKVPENANDTDATNESFWSASPYPQWWKVDLQGLYNITAIIIRNYYQSNHYYQYEIWGSQDDVNFIKIAEKKNNNPVTDSGDFYNLNAIARYLKVIITYSTSNNSVQISDFRAYGTPVSIWNGSVSNDWNNAGNWTPENIPVSSALVIIPSAGITNFPTISATTVCRKITMESGATLVDKGPGSGYLSTSDSACIKQNLSPARAWSITPPVNAASPHGLRKIYKYFENDNTWVEVPSMSAGSGYIVMPNTTTDTIVFNGILNNGNQSIGLTRSTANMLRPGFNLVGNPYPSYLNIEALTSNPDLVPSYWSCSKISANNQWHFNTYNIASGISTNPGGFAVDANIPPMQAFWLLVKNGHSSSTIILNNSMRHHADTNANKLKVPSAGNLNWQLLRLHIFNETDTDETVIYSCPEASNAYDAYDSPKMMNDSSSTVPNIYTIADNEKLAINGMNKIPQNVEIPLIFRSNKSASDSFKIRATEIRNLSSDINVMLKDKNTGIETNLTDTTTTYEFAASARTIRNFSLIFKTSGPTTVIQNNALSTKVQVYMNSNNQIVIKFHGDKIYKYSISVCNALGQKLMHNQFSTSEITINTLPTGIYLVTITGSGIFTTKRVIVN